MAEELKGRSNRRERRTCSNLSFHLFKCLQAPTCTMYLYKVLKTRGHTQTTKEKRGREKKNTLVHLSGGGLFPKTILKEPPVFLTLKSCLIAHMQIKTSLFIISSTLGPYLVSILRKNSSFISLI